MRANLSIVLDLEERNQEKSFYHREHRGDH